VGFAGIAAIAGPGVLRGGASDTGALLLAGVWVATRRA
jgi:hypothetical protein